MSCLPYAVRLPLTHNEKGARFLTTAFAEIAQSLNSDLVCMTQRHSVLESAPNRAVKQYISHTLVDHPEEFFYQIFLRTVC